MVSPDIRAFVNRSRRDALRRFIGLAPLTPEPAPPAPEPVVSPAPVRAPDAAALLRARVDALVCLAAEALDASPRGLRAPLALVFRRMHELCVEPDAAAELLEATAREP
jgi:hypothetical protein